jgi:hypothetical protein
MAKSEIQRFEDNFDKIVKYYLDEKSQDKLSPELQAQLKRWKFIRLVYSSWKITIKREVVNALVKEFGVDEATAYRDIANAQRLYARLEEVNKEFERIIRIEEIKALRSKCISKGDLKTAAECDKNLIKIGGYDKELQAPKVVQNITNEIVFDPRLVDGEVIPDIERVVAQFLVKKKREVDQFDHADIITEEMNGGGSGS